MSIKPLPPEVVAQVKSSSLITSLNGVVLGLLRNSLDANASKVNISVDYRLGNCVVEDNGSGIPEAEFQETGGLGKLHFTSKYPPRDNVYGRAGAFLFSVATLSLLSMTSHHQRQNSHATLILHNSELVSRHIPALPDQRVLAFPHGTRATVRDLFGSMPVRVKQRALELARLGSGRNWSQLVRMVVSLLLGFSGIVAITLRDMQSSRILTLKSESSSLISKTSRLLSKALGWDNPEGTEWVPLSASSSGVVINGCISLAPAPSKRLQFVTLGIEPISDDFKSNVLLDEINRVFACSRFGILENPESDISLSASNHNSMTFNESRKAKKGIDRWPVFYIKISLQALAPNPAIASTQAVLDDGHDALPKILYLLKAMFYAFLNKHNFGPDKGKLFSSTLRRSPAKRTRLMGNSQDLTILPSEGSRSAISMDRAPKKLRNSFSQPSGMTVSNSQSNMGDLNSRLVCSSMTAMPQPVVTNNSLQDLNPRNAALKGAIVKPGAIAMHRWAVDGGSTSRMLSHVPGTNHEIAPNQASSLIQKRGDKTPEGCIHWENPLTKVMSLVDTRTGFIMQPVNRQECINLNKNLTTSATQENKSKEASPWLKGLLAKWENPVFDTTEPSIPRLAATQLEAGGVASNQGSCSLNLGHQSDKESLVLEGRFSKSSLRHCEVVAQVDQKFILAKLPIVRQFMPSDGQTVCEHDEKATKATPSLALVVIDQHAADERCRVEALMASYFELVDVPNGDTTLRPVTNMLPNPVAVDLSSQECNLLERFMPHFQRWGIIYEMALASRSRTRLATTCKKGIGAQQPHSNRICVTSLPPSILERCRSEPNLLVELLRTEVWRLEGNETIARTAFPAVGKSSPCNRSDKAKHSWVALFHGCPPGILELINSRACRSAIMFGDILSIDDCRALLERLGKCTFPFQCAHGRPSMVPLLELGGTLELGTDFSDYNQWHSKNPVKD